MNIGATARIASNVGPLVAVGDGVVRFKDGKWLARLEGRNAVGLPPAEDPVEDVVHIAAQRSPAAHRQLVSNGEHQPLRSVVAAHGFLGAQVG